MPWKVGRDMGGRELLENRGREGTGDRRKKGGKKDL